jgi:hypothetical protein
MTIRRLIRLLAILDGKTHKGGCAVLVVAGVAAVAAGAVGMVIL